MNTEEHKARHANLHYNLDELLADFIASKGVSVLNLPIIDLITWSCAQTTNPDHDA